MADKMSAYCSIFYSLSNTESSTECCERPVIPWKYTEMM